jgi:hypothetical protein
MLLLDWQEVLGRVRWQKSAAEALCQPDKMSRGSLWGKDNDKGKVKPSESDCGKNILITIRSGRFSMAATPTHDRRKLAFLHAKRWSWTDSGHRNGDRSGSGVSDSQLAVWEEEECRQVQKIEGNVARIDRERGANVLSKTNKRTSV